MGNNWGAQNSNPLPAVYTPTGDVSCTAGAATTIITSGALSTVVPGAYYPMIQLELAILLGGTAPSALTIKFILGSGSAVDTYTVEPGLLVNSAELYPGPTLIGANSASAWSGAGSTINIQITPTGQAVTCKQVGSRAVISLLRGPDA